MPSNHDLKVVATASQHEFFINLLVVEIDGKVHKFRKDLNAIQEEIILNKSIQVIRFPNRDVEKDIAGVLRRLEIQIFGTE